MNSNSDNNNSRNVYIGVISYDYELLWCDDEVFFKPFYSRVINNLKKYLRDKSEVSFELEYDQQSCSVTMSRIEKNDTILCRVSLPQERVSTPGVDISINRASTSLVSYARHILRMLSDSQDDNSKMVTGAAREMLRCAEEIYGDISASPSFSLNSGEVRCVQLRRVIINSLYKIEWYCARVGIYIEPLLDVSHEYVSINAQMVEMIIYSFLRLVFKSAEINTSVCLDIRDNKKRELVLHSEYTANKSAEVFDLSSDIKTIGTMISQLGGSSDIRLENSAVVVDMFIPFVPVQEDEGAKTAGNLSVMESEMEERSVCRDLYDGISYRNEFRSIVKGYSNVGLNDFGSYILSSFLQ